MSEPAATEVAFEHLVALRHRAARGRRLAAPSVMRPGGLAGRRRGAGLDIHDIRAFVDGDDLRHADPAATARTGRLHVRTFHEERDRAALLVADFRRPMLWATQGRLRSVTAAEALATVGWRVIDAGGKIGLLAAREDGLDHVAVRARERTMFAVAGALEESHRRALDGARAVAASRHGTAWPRSGSAPGENGDLVTRMTRAPEPLHAVLERAGRLVPPGGTIVCATGLDTPGESFSTVVGAILRRRRLVVILVCDPLETRPPDRTFAFYGDDGIVVEGRFPREADARAGALRQMGAIVEVVETADPAMPDLDELGAL